MFADPYGDDLEYANLKSRIATFLGTLASKEYRAGFKEMKSDEKNTFILDYQGKGDVPSATLAAYGRPADSEPSMCVARAYPNCC